MILDETNRKDLIFLILQFLNEEGYEGSLHLLEQDSGIFFNFSYFSYAILNGNSKDAEDYLSAFTSPDANTYSRKMFFDLFKWKFLEASDRIGGSESVNIFSKDLRQIPVFKDDSFDDLVEVIAPEDIRISEQACCLDKSLVRVKLCADLRKQAESNPSLSGKLVFPNLNKSALLSLIILICPTCEGKNGGLKEDLMCLILQFLHEAKYKNTLHKLEQESKVFFNLNYLAEVMRLGELDKAEEYLAAFTDTHKNKYSKAIFLEIQKLKRLEFTEWEVTTPYGSLDNISAKLKLHASVAMLAKKNPVLKDKLKFPSMEKSRLLTLIQQIMDWWKPRTCNNPYTLENIPVVPYLSGASSSFKNKFSETGRRANVDNCEVKEISDPSECNALALPDYCSGGRIVRMTYSLFGDYILALAEDGRHKLWTWSSSPYESCKENVFPKPRLHQPQSGKTMKNEIATSSESSTSCFAIKGSYNFSTSGGKIAVFDLKSFEKVAAFGSHTPTATYFIFIPGDLLAVGLDDGSIFMHCLSSRKIKEKLEGHNQRITCLAFSHCFNVLVSSGADGKLCGWCTKSWVKLTSDNPMHKFCTRRDNHEFSSLVTHIQFDPYQIELLVVQEGCISVLEAPTLDCLMQWLPNESDTSITSATYSSDGEIIYVGFRSGSLKILDSKTFSTICRVNLTAITQPIPSNIRLEVYPVVVAAHPSHPSQISVGLSNGKVIVFQPLGSGGWGESAPPEDGEGYSDGSNETDY
ncbi:topless-related protein 4 isoform X2 [Eutrema salsugineum]|nr:topless-related protein 4 isoform X2 [Eutrema salsugineum]